MKTQITILLFAIIMIVSACRNEKKQSANAETTTVVKTDSALLNGSKTIETGDLKFPSTGAGAQHFVPTNYKIDLETEGDLNHDNLKDKVIVLINKTDTTDKRVTLILLKQQDNTFKLDQKSFASVEPKYTADGYQIYETEDVDIDSLGTLTFQMYGVGPSGNLFSSYKYIDNKLMLININSYSMGAGGHTELDLDILKGIYKETNTNTMKEDMPSETKTKKYKIGTVLFENSNPKDIVIKAFDVNGVK